MSAFPLSPKGKGNSASAFLKFRLRGLEKRTPREIAHKGCERLLREVFLSERIIGLAYVIKRLVHGICIAVILYDYAEPSKRAFIILRLIIKPADIHLAPGEPVPQERNYLLGLLRVGAFGSEVPPPSHG